MRDKITYWICGIDGPFWEVQGVPFGHLAVREGVPHARGDGPAYIIDHVPSGAYVAQLHSRRFAYRVAELLSGYVDGRPRIRSAGDDPVARSILRMAYRHGFVLTAGFHHHGA